MPKSGCGRVGVSRNDRQVVLFFLAHVGTVNHLAVGHGLKLVSRYGDVVDLVMCSSAFASLGRASRLTGSVDCDQLVIIEVSLEMRAASFLFLWFAIVVDVVRDVLACGAVGVDE